MLYLAVIDLQVRFNSIHDDRSNADEAQVCVNFDDRRIVCFSFAPTGTTMMMLSRMQKHTLPDLPYDYGALEPTISAAIMQLHHQKHHATYVNNLNVAEEKMQEALAKG